MLLTSKIFVNATDNLLNSIRTIPDTYLLAAGVIAFLFLALASPFRYPHMTIKIDVGNRRKPKTMDLVDEFLIGHGMSKVKRHEAKVSLWKKRSEHRIERSIFKRYRSWQYEQCLDDRNAYIFRFRRGYETLWEYKCSYKVIENRDAKLAEINYSAALNDYMAAKERQKMTPKLRKQIKERDGYRCRICGKRIPSGKGLEIDHIIPISKGGKTIPSNLQTLCFECNRHKSDKLHYKKPRRDIPFIK